jgi:Ca-activated chloride channel family protein
MLKQLAEGAGGLAAFVSQQDDFSRQSQAFRRKLMRPVASDVSININGLETYDVTPRDLPDLFYGSPLRIYGRYKGSGAAKIDLKAEIMGQSINQAFDANLPTSNNENPEIERMWAFNRVQELSNEMRLGGDKESIVGQIVNLCEGYSIVSEYASFIVLENDAEYKRWAIDRRNATRVKRDNVAREALKKELEGLRNESIAGLGPQDPNAKNATQGVDLATTPVNSTLPPSVSNGNNINWANQGNSQSRSPSTGGGGAIDPITGMIAAGLAGAAAWAARRKNRSL